MSSAIADGPRAARDIAFEQRLFMWSPFGAFTTAVILYVVLVGSYLLLAIVSHAPIFEGPPARLHIESGVLQAAILSLLAATILGMQRYTALKEIADAPAFAAISSNSAVSVSIIHPASPRQMVWANIGGVAIGIAFALTVVPFSLLNQYPALFVWHFLLTVFLCSLFGRGLLMTTQGSRAFAQLIDRDLKLDLLHVDRLAVIGRHSARNSLIWFTCAAVICLFFVGGGVSATTLLTIVICAGLGLWIFFRPMERVHRHIRMAKEIELGRIRDEIAKARDGAVHDASAATRLQGLLAYEARIQNVHEWPFDQSTMVRVAAYVLIPAIPWFGEAVVSDIVQRLAH